MPSGSPVVCSYRWKNGHNTRWWLGLGSQLPFNVPFNLRDNGCEDWIIKYLRLASQCPFAHCQRGLGYFPCCFQWSVARFNGAFQLICLRLFSTTKRFLLACLNSSIQGSNSMQAESVAILPQIIFFYSPSYLPLDAYTTHLASYQRTAWTTAT